MATQAAQALKNLEAVVEEAADFHMKEVVKATVFITEMA